MKELVALIVISFVMASHVSGQIEPRGARNAKEVAIFKKTHACPATGEFSGPCSGFVVDHIIPLATYGPDRADNMQWQSIEEAKHKDKLEFEAYLVRVRAEKKMAEELLRCQDALILPDKDLGG